MGFAFNRRTSVTARVFKYYHLVTADVEGNMLRF